MKINEKNNLPLSKLQQAYLRENKNITPDFKSTQESKDSFAISKEAQALLSYVKQTSLFPEVRTELVTSIRNSLSNRTYTVNPEEVATGILRELKREKL